MTCPAGNTDLSCYGDAVRVLAVYRTHDAHCAAGGGGTAGSTAEKAPPEGGGASHNGYGQRPKGRAEWDGAAAAVRCTVGAGTAVLCGTHPELGPRWLRQSQSDSAGGIDDGDGPAAADTPGAGVSTDQPEEKNGVADEDCVRGHVERLVDELERGQAGRRLLWHVLLRAALCRPSCGAL